ncbi:enoyl-ACP reductase FabI [Geminisphaera colitermitum]|uniref:enoyl-ACP reductase FabI n=1 Tax=Geminisphaera colitermitum TaxID=1148786 RepID=UPI0001965025|nr:SDR family oxidoreductase [Geminisphaera colitermitum]
MSADFLQLSGKTILVLGVANRKSVAWLTAKTLEEQGARVLYSVRSEARKKSLETLLADRPVFVCDVEHEGAVERLAAEVSAAQTAAGLTGANAKIHGIVHSIAFANYSDGPAIKSFHETKRADFLQATTISAFSLVELARAFKPHLAPDASVVTIGISSLLVTPDNYGYMGPIKAALESATRFLAKSFSSPPAPPASPPAASPAADTRNVRFNVIGSGPLKTSASAGIPGYLESYLYAEKLTYRKKNLSTQEVANATVFLLSPRSSGINGTTLTIDAGLGSNYFDAEIVRLAMRPDLQGRKDT